MQVLWDHPYNNAAFNCPVHTNHEIMYIAEVRTFSIIHLMISLNSEMKKWILIFPLLMAFLAQTASYEIYRVKNQAILLINCGAEGWEDYEGWSWAPDEGYINTGKTKSILQTNINIPGYMNSLRYFSRGVTNCYKVFPDPKYKFLFRAGFYYGNYDGLSRPPTFDLLLDGGFWATVNTSESDQAPIYKEILYSPKGESTSICLVMTHINEVPFISSLVMAFVFTEDRAKPVYKLMGNNTALHLVSRNFFGGLDQVIRPWTWTTCDEYTFRIWQPKSVAGYLNVSYNVDNENTIGYCLGFNYENRPPDSLLKNAISPVNASDSISLQVDFKNRTQQNAYFVLYFMDYNLSSKNQNVTRKFQIYIDGASKKVVDLNGDEFGQVVTLYPVEVTGTANLSISPVNGSDFPPILNGIEVYTASEIVDTGGGFKLQCSCAFVLFFFVNYLWILFV